MVFSWTRGGFEGVSVRWPDGTVRELDLPFTAVHGLRAAGQTAVVVVAATPLRESAVARIEIGAEGTVEGLDTLRPSRDLQNLGVPESFISVPEEIDYPSADGRTAHALLFPPTNPEALAPEGELPPLLVEVHGGPTAAACAELDLDIQYWTSRGFMVVSVNYGGSTGYGRSYRELLRGQGGVVDVADSIAVARWLVDQGRVDPSRMAIRGGSAGGYTTLAALVAPDTPFTAG